MCAEGPLDCRLADGNGKEQNGKISQLFNVAKLALPKYFRRNVDKLVGERWAFFQIELKLSFKGDSQFPDKCFICVSECNV